MKDRESFLERNSELEFERDERARKEILERLDLRKDGPVERFAFCSRFPPEAGRMNYNDDLLSLLKGVVREGKLLDIFAGSQSTRAFFQREGVETQVTSVDITPGRADFTVSVADLTAHLVPEKQFSCVLSLGAHPGFTNFGDINRYLQDDGYFITGGDHGMFERYDERFFGGSELSFDEAQAPYFKELKGASHYFHPVMVVTVHDIRGWYQDYFKEKGITARVDKTYVFWKKGAMELSS